MQTLLHCYEDVSIIKVTIQLLANFLFFCGSFHNSVSDSYYTTYNGRMNDKMEKMQKEVVMA
jgi:hypothetical protein